MVQYESRASDRESNQSLDSCYLRYTYDLKNRRSSSENCLTSTPIRESWRCCPACGCYGSLAAGGVGTSIIAQKKIHCTVAHGPKLALRGVTSHLVSDMCMYSHTIVGVSPHDYGRAMVGYICPTHTVSVTYKLGVTAAGMIGHAPSPRPTEGKRPIAVRLQG
jgi:hypothetical protein